MLERELLPTFYARQDVQNVDLNQLFLYDDAAFRAHNRAFHGCGVVCGLEVRLGEREGQVWAVVSPGYALSPAGDEIDVREEAWVAIDCARPVETDCEELEQAEPGGPFAPAYVVLRPTTRMGRSRPLAPARCADRECAPTRVCAGFEAVCAATRPEACPPPFDLACCSAERIIHAALIAGDLGDTGLFGCLPPAGEPAITLARVDFERDEARRLVPRLSFDDRAYVPAIQFLFDLAHIAGAQTLKRPWIAEPAISFLGQPPVRRLRLNRGVELDNLVVRGRGLRRVVAAAASLTEVDINSFATVAGPQADSQALMSLRVPLIMSAAQFSLRLTTAAGEVYDSGDQPIPALVALHDNAIEDIPLLRSAGAAFTVARLKEVGYPTAQSVAGEHPVVLFIRFNQELILIFQRMTLSRATLLVNNAREWLRAGAPGATQEL